MKKTINFALLFSTLGISLPNTEATLIKRVDSTTALYEYSQNKPSLSPFSLEEYVSLMERFLAANKSLVDNHNKYSDSWPVLYNGLYVLPTRKGFEAAYNSNVSTLRNFIKIFGVKTYPGYHSPLVSKIRSVDLSAIDWDEVFKCFKLSADSNDSLGQLFGNYTQLLEGIHNDTEQFELEVSKISEIMQTIMGRSPDYLLDITPLSSESEKVYTSMLQSMLGNAEDFQHIMVLVVAAFLNRRSVALPKTISFLENFRSVYIPEIISIDMSWPNLKNFVEPELEGIEAIDPAGLSKDKELELGHLKWLIENPDINTIIDGRELEPATLGKLQDLIIDLVLCRDSTRLFDISDIIMGRLATFFNKIQHLNINKIGDSSVKGIYKNIIIKDSFTDCFESEEDFKKFLNYLRSDKKTFDLIQNFINSADIIKALENFEILKTALEDRHASNIDALNFTNDEIRSKQILWMLMTKYHDIFVRSLKEIIINPSGLQRLMSLLSLDTLNRHRKIFNHWSKPNIEVSLNSEGKNSHSELKINLDVDSLGNPWTFFHEMTHAYHYMVKDEEEIDEGLSMSDQIDEDLSIRDQRALFNFFILNSRDIDFIDEFFPILKTKINFGDYNGELSEEGLFKDVFIAIKYGFGNFLFENKNYEPSDLEIQNLAQNNTFIKKCLYLSSNILPMRTSAEEVSDRFWTNIGEMLTIVGLYPLWVEAENEEDRIYVIVEDRQNENIFKVLADKSPGRSQWDKEQQYFRFHARLCRQKRIDIIC